MACSSRKCQSHLVYQGFLELFVLQEAIKSKAHAAWACGKEKTKWQGREIGQVHQLTRQHWATDCVGVC